MATVDVKASAAPAWALANPWCWGLVGLGGCALAFAWARLLGETAPALRYSFVAIGLLATAAAVWLRLQSRAGILDSLPRVKWATSVLGLIALDGLLVVGSTGLLFGQLTGAFETIWSLPSVVWMWLAVTPWCAARAALLLNRRGAGQPLGASLESSSLMTLAALSVFLACWAFYSEPEYASHCDSLRLLLSVAALVLFAAAPLVAAPSWLRRVLISVLAIMHLGGIVIAASAATPGPWLSAQVWMHFYRPYLEFMYLNNAYRFYAPEPSSSTQLWFRIEYKDPNSRAEDVLWTKLPKMDAAGNSLYTVGLQFQRRLALTENVTRTMPLSMGTFDENGKLIPNAAWKRRAEHLPKEQREPEIVGEPLPQNTKLIPYHPDKSTNQFAEPQPLVKLMLQSYARHILSQPHPMKPEMKAVQVKIYRVLHRMADPQLLAMGVDPQDETLFLPYYQGTFDTEGKLLDPEDPFLYWMLPILRETPMDPNSRILSWVKFHAGDADWIKSPPLRQMPFGRP